MSDWISVADHPLVFTSPTGAKYPTEAGKDDFFAAFRGVDIHTGKIFYSISYVTLDDECNIRDVNYEELEEYGIDTYYTSSVDEIAYYYHKPKPPEI